MKKLLGILLCLFLVSCAKREDYYILSFEGYRITVGYDDVTYLRQFLDFECKDTLKGNEVIEDIDLYYDGEFLGTMSLYNKLDSQCDSTDAIISKLTIYLCDNDIEDYYLDGDKLEKSIASSCEIVDGKLLKQNGVACLLEKNVHGKKDTVVLYGDILNIDQDILDHLEIYVK